MVVAAGDAMVSSSCVGSLVRPGTMSVTVDLRRIMSRRLTITGSTLRARTVAEKAAIAAALHADVWPRLERGGREAVSAAHVSARRGRGRARPDGIEPPAVRYGTVHVPTGCHPEVPTASWAAT